MKRPRRLALACALLAALLAGGCGSGKVREDPMLALSAEEALAQGRELLEAGKYNRAQLFFVHAFEVEPNSPSGREGLLLAADSLFLAGGSSNYIKAEAKYRDFLNRFPTSERSAYVQFQIANCLAERIRKPDRDQSPTRQALEAYRELLQIYPDSEYASKALEQIEIVRHTLAEHEIAVGEFNYNFKLYDAAAARFRTVVEEYPEYPEMDRVLYELVRALRKSEKPEEARTVLERLREEHPGSPFVARLSKKGDA